MKQETSISIWYFIGLLLLTYGVMITGAGIWEAMRPPEKPVVLSELHAGIWWGLLLLALGLVYTYYFSPSRQGKAK